MLVSDNYAGSDGSASVTARSAQMITIGAVR